MVSTFWRTVKIKRNTDKPLENKIVQTGPAGYRGGHSGVGWGPPVIEKDSPEPKGDGRDKRNVPTKRRLHACSLLGMLEAVVISATVVASASVVAASATAIVVASTVSSSQIAHILLPPKGLFMVYSMQGGMSMFLSRTVFL